MNKSLYRWLLRLSLLIFLVACSPKSPQTATVTSSASSEPSAAAQTRVLSSQPSEVVTDVTQLRRTDYFLPSALVHIFQGDINRHGKAGGYHYEGFPEAKGQVVAKSKTKPDAHGVYRAKVTIDGVSKQAQSTFFPQEWTPQQVVDAINEAYEKRVHQSGNVYQATIDNGVSIQLYVTEDGAIISAFPLYQP